MIAYDYKMLHRIHLLVLVTGINASTSNFCRHLLNDELFAVCENDDFTMARDARAPTKSNR